MAEKLFLETTEVPAAKSLGELTAVLVKAGARSIQTHFDGGKPSGLRWSMDLYGHVVWFELPVKVEPVFQVLRKRKPGLNATQVAHLRATAERVAWRQLLMWVKVQMALIELNMVEFAQVFLPYVHDANRNESVWEAFREQRFKELPAASA
jgi:hypothetical protein